MNVSIGYCRVKLKSGLIVFGEVLETTPKYIVFQEIDPSATEERIKIADIAEFEEYDEDDIPQYE